MTDFRQERRPAPDRQPGQVRRAAAEPADGTVAAAVVVEAARRLRASGHLYFELELVESAGIAVTVRHHRPEDVVLGEYGERFYTEDPLTETFRERLCRNGASVHGPVTVSLGELPWLARASYENRFLRRAGIADVLGLGVPASIDGRTRMLCFGFHRGETDPGFTTAERRLLSRLADGLGLRAENLALRQALASRPPAGPSMTAFTAAAAGLTERERQVAGLMMAGHGNGRLAHELGLTINTVENHLRSIYAKLGVRSRGQAGARMLGNGAEP
ncbi:response regulator transcription factor [Rhizosaccharibacter radicis]|uniref:LuxR C-terminal-related transcriptional regulator n=1 Tax=Rhizosaccharibacter radicis TaxID=2782605 RepID=A0ABT1VVC9_9PROT|nr:LuxR C-terminal-related transcriptional regulator [Acetobacteraceae bacterium KSS12]